MSFCHLLTSKLMFFKQSVLRHDSRNKVKHSWWISMLSLGIDPGSPQFKTNALTTEPKSRLSDAVARDWLYTRSYAKSTLCRYIGESAWPIIHSLSLKRSSFLMTERHFSAKQRFNPRWAPILRHDSNNKVKHNWKISSAITGNQTRVTLVQDQCSNHWAKEPTLWCSSQRLIIY